MLAPDCVLFYGDEDVRRADGQHDTPCFKPDYSPHFQSQRPYIGGGAFIRAGALRELGRRSDADFLAGESEWLARLLSTRASVHHVRRIVHHRAAMTATPPDVPRETSEGPWPQAAIVIPTRDRAPLLAACMGALLNRTEYPNFKIVLVDNGSSEPEALALLERLAKKDRVIVLRVPGPFNFSALCNQGAAATASPLLVFLNNDVVVQGVDWLKRLVGWALQPDIGVAGAKLVYPDGRVQHAGDIVGIGESAGQRAHKAGTDFHGYPEPFSSS